jgi:hypothetical protein
VSIELSIEYQKSPRIKLFSERADFLHPVAGVSRVLHFGDVYRSVLQLVAFFGWTMDLAVVCLACCLFFQRFFIHYRRIE